MTDAAALAASITALLAIMWAVLRGIDWLSDRRANGGELPEPTTAGTWTCEDCGAEVPLEITGRTVVVELDTTDAELHEMTHEEAP